MGFFTSRERGELGKSAEPRLPSREREVVRHDFAPRRRPQPTEPDLTGHVGTLMRRVSDSSLRDIDDLIDRLQRRREQLLAESERVQREIIEYAKLSQTTMQSTKIISESLAHFNKVPDAPRMSELHLADGDDAERRNGRADAFAPHDDAERRNGRADAFALHDDDQSTHDDEDHGTPDAESDTDGAETPARSQTA
ncbi:MAG TPA: hypothetical protein VKD43_05940 [Xanthobacteraceae bacterium]|nr:hypothetical protein [Xanthobacteraceae bacterium]